MDARRGWVTAAFVLWGIVVAAGVAEMAHYEETPGVQRSAPKRWPEGSALSRARDGVTVVMFIHPKCPCRRASEAQLAEIMRAAPATTRFSVSTDLAEARRFGAKTSGQVVVYDAHGELRFSVGFSFARGQAGKNIGQEIVDALVHGGRPERTTTPVNGTDHE